MEAFKAGCAVLYKAVCEVLHEHAEHAEGAGIAVCERAIESGLPHPKGKISDEVRRVALRKCMEVVASKYNLKTCAEKYHSVIREVAN